MALLYQERQSVTDHAFSPSILKCLAATNAIYEEFIIRARIIWIIFRNPTLKNQYKELRLKIDYESMK